MITLLDIYGSNENRSLPPLPTEPEIPNEKVETLYASRYYEGSIAFDKIDNILNQCKNVKNICFWTKRPDKLIEIIKKYRKYNVVCFVTITPYNNELEPNVPNKGRVIIPAFKELSAIIGTKNIFWIYEPVFVSNQYNAEKLCNYFEIIAKNLNSLTNYCLYDFATPFQKIQLRLNGVKTRELSNEEKTFLERNFISIAKENNINAMSIKNKNFWTTLNIDLKNKKDAGRGVSCSLNCAYCYGYCGNNIKNIDPTPQSLD